MRLAGPHYAPFGLSSASSWLANLRRAASPLQLSARFGDEGSKNQRKGASGLHYSRSVGTSRMTALVLEVGEEGQASFGGRGRGGSFGLRARGATRSQYSCSCSMKKSPAAPRLQLHPPPCSSTDARPPSSCPLSQLLPAEFPTASRKCENSWRWRQERSELALGSFDCLVVATAPSQRASGLSREASSALAASGELVRCTRVQVDP